MKTTIIAFLLLSFLISSKDTFGSQDTSRIYVIHYGQSMMAGFAEVEFGDSIKIKLKNKESLSFKAIGEGEILLYIKLRPRWQANPPIQEYFMNLKIEEGKDVYIVFDAIRSKIINSSIAQGILTKSDYAKQEHFEIKYCAKLITESNSNVTQGSGFIVSKKGYILTCNHVVKSSDSVTVYLYDKGIQRELHGKVVIRDPANDIALIKVEDLNLDTVNLQFNRLSQFPIGTDVFVFGYPLTSSMGKNVKLTNGIISSKTGFKDAINSYQITAPVQPGNSGGPCFDDFGNIVGIVNAKHDNAENVTYVIKLSYILPTLLNVMELDHIEKSEDKIGFESLQNQTVLIEIKN
jgi:S1-C subfamily serine protease